MGCMLDKMVKLDILVFKSLSFLIGNAAACYILNFTCGKLCVFVVILLLILIWNVWSLILKVMFGKETCLVLNCIFLYFFVWNVYNAHALEHGCHRDM